MFVIKENLKYGEDYLTYTATERASECFRILTESEGAEDVAVLNRQLEHLYGVVSCRDKLLPVYEIVSIKAGWWRCKCCGVSVTQHSKMLSDYSRFTVKNRDGDVMGSIFRQTVSEIVLAMELLDSGGCPVCGGWSDGTGNTCSPRGWGRTEFMFKDCILITKYKKTPCEKD